MEIILSTGPDWAYNLFYALAILIAVIVLFIEGNKRNFDLLPWTLTICTTLTVFIIGCTFITFQKHEWETVVRNELLNHHVGASMLGGIIFSIPILLLLWRVYKYPTEMLDAFAFILPIGMATERIGCLLSGCCYGTVCDLPWAITYSWHEQHISLHPVQLYESVGCLISIALIATAPRYLRRPASKFLLSLLCYFLVRFICEFFRAHEREFVTGFLFALNSTQIIVAALALISMLLIAWLEAFNNKVKESVYIEQRHWLQITCHLGIFVIISIVSFKWLRIFDIYIILCLVSLSTAQLAWQFYRSRIMVPAFKIASVFLLALSLVSMSQSSAPQKNKSKTVDRYNTIGFGFSGQQLTLTKQTGVTGGNCGTTPIYTYFELAAVSGSVSLSRTWLKDNNHSYTFGVNSYITSVKETISGAGSGSSKFGFVGFNPSFTTSSPLVEFRLGAHVGDLTRFKTDIDETLEKSTIAHSSFYPQAGLRLGYTKTFFVNTQVYSSPAAVIPSSPFSIGVGSGFGSKNGDYLELGHSSFALIYAAGRVTAGKNLWFKPYVGLGSGLFNHFEEKQRGVTFAFTLSTNIRRKKKD